MSPLYLTSSVFVHLEVATHDKKIQKYFVNMNTHVLDFLFF